MSDVTTAVVDCYNCQSSESEFYIRENGFTMVRCTSCDLLYVRERPTDEMIDSATVAGEHHGERNLHVDVQYNPRVKPRYRTALDDIYGPDGLKQFDTWLDVGCGHGEFIEVLAERGGNQLAVTGSEPNLTKQESARSRGLNVTYFDLDQHEQVYDVVSLMNVYSHLADPKAFLKSMASVVRPGGEILLQTGDAAHLSAKDMLKPLCLPDHLSFASEGILREMLDELGFDVHEVYNYPGLALTPVQVLKECAKFVLPGRASYLPHYLQWWKYRSLSMYVRAVKRP